MTFKDAKCGVTLAQEVAFVISYFGRVVVRSLAAPVCTLYILGQDTNPQLFSVGFVKRRDSPNITVSHR